MTDARVGRVLEIVERSVRTKGQFNSIRSWKPLMFPCVGRNGEICGQIGRTMSRIVASPPPSVSQFLCSSCDNNVGIYLRILNVSSKHSFRITISSNFRYYYFIRYRKMLPLSYLPFSFFFLLFVFQTFL